MRFKAIILGIVAFLGLASIAYAKSDSYYPPERISCKLNDMNKLSCEEFNRRYLVEDATNADIEPNETFHFVSAVAYFASGHEETSIFFTYNNPQRQVVKLKTVDVSIRPDLVNGNWKMMTDDIYTCDAAYMQCSITNLPN